MLQRALPRPSRMVDEVLVFERAIAGCAKLQPAVVVLHLDGNAMDIGSFAGALRAACPAAHLVVIADQDHDEDLVRCVEAGADAFVPMSSDIGTLAEAIRAVRLGRSQIDPERLQRSIRATAEARHSRALLQRRFDRLTKRERDVLRLAADGVRNDEIAEALHISVRTVDTHVSNLLRKLGVHSKLMAVALAQKAGWLTDEANREPTGFHVEEIP